MIYLDHAATAPVLPEAAEAMHAVLARDFANPGARYPAGLSMQRQVDAWRQTVARAMDCPPERFFFTSCGTESDVWAIRAACWHNRHAGRHIVATAGEHSAVLNTCRQLAQEGWEVTYVQPEKDGTLPARAVLEAVRPETAVVSVMLVQNELGTVYPVGEIAAGLKAANPRTLLHTDAVQGFLHLPFSAAASGADLVSVSGHKVGGPKGVGGLYIAPRLSQPRPLLPGGGQEGGYRSGTEATAQMAGFARAAAVRHARLREDLARLAALNAYARGVLGSLPDVTVLSPPDGASHILALSLAGWPGENLVTDLGTQGICIATGAACRRGRPGIAASLLGLPKREAAGVFRVSFGPETTEAELDALSAAVRRHHDTRLPLL